MRTCLSLFALLATSLLLLAQPPGGEATLDPDQPYQARKSHPVSYEVDFSAVVTPPYQCKTLKIWLPLPESDAGQEVASHEITSFPISVKPKIATEPLYGNRFAYFEFERPKGAQIIRHRFDVKVWELHWDVDPAKVTAVDKWPAGFDRFLRAEGQAVVINDRVREIAKEVVTQRQTAAQDMTQIMSWVNGQMKYDHVLASLQASSEFALANRRGHCSDYHGLCAALGRALNYPTRVTYGINPSRPAS